jgi:hypothetical protein
MTPCLSIVLATDTESTIRPVLDHLLRQTLASALEILLVSPAPIPAPAGFAAVRHVPHPVDDLASARAAGVRAASAPLVFIGETHSFPEPGFAERTLAAFADPHWSVVVPAIRNANPIGILSWAGFLCDYGAWAEELPAGPLHQVPVYNATFRTQLLLDLGDRLPRALDQGDDLLQALRASGRQALFLPSTKVEHTNTTQLGPWIRNRFLGGLLIASNRAKPWPWTRRLPYAAGAFLVPAVLYPRLRAGLQARTERGPAGTFAGLLFSLLLRAAGETLGYAGLFVSSARTGMLDIELHKLQYAQSARSH